MLTADGWLRTGDIGVIGEEGDLFVVDRSKDLVIVSGFNVFPAEVENVVGVGSRRGRGGGHRPARPGDGRVGRSRHRGRARGGGDRGSRCAPTCAANLARYKCPTSIRFVDELPHGLVGKALRRALRDQSA